MRSGWTGGQYSLFRVLFGAYLAVHFAALVPWGAELFSSAGALPDAATSPLVRLFPNVLLLWDGPAFVTALLVLACVAAVLFAAGWRDRAAAWLLWYVLACTYGRNPLIANPSLPYVGLLLVVHALLPRAPFGSWEARGRTDPDGGWRMRPDLFGVVWVLMAVGYSYSGVTKLVSPSWCDGTAVQRLLENPLARPHALNEALLALPEAVLAAATWGALALELAFAPLALLARARPWIWTATLAMHVALLATIDFADLSLGMIALHLFTFDPAWVRGRRSTSRETVYYDGTCSLCHGTVRFVLAEDRAAQFGFAPLQEARDDELGESRETLPDSLLVKTESGELLLRSSAVAHILIALGGLWRPLGHVLAALPRPLRDLGYDAIARVRYRVFGREKTACPMLPEHLRDRFTLR